MVSPGSQIVALFKYKHVQLLRLVNMFKIIHNNQRLIKLWNILY